MNRRHVFYGSAAALAAVAGAGAAWWVGHGPVPAAGSVSGGQVGNDAASAGGAEQSFWALSFDTPQGKPLALNSFRGKPLLVNFWATWCPPCVEELPLLDYFYQENKAKGWQALGLAVDQPSAVRAWLQTRPLNFPVAMAGFHGTELSKSLGNLSGGLPFSVVFGASGEVLHRKIGKVLPQDLAHWATLKS